jgi:hypothetical protein
MQGTYCNIVAPTYMMEPFTVERLVYDGSDPSDDWIITGIGHSKLNIKNVATIPIDSYNDYIRKCPIHGEEECRSHMCKTPSGLMLPPQSLAIDTPVIRNDVARAASFAFQGSLPFYKDKANKILFDSMKTKTGRMRSGILNCHVDGSLRMVITPHTYDHRIIFIPSYLKDKWKVVRLDPETQRYVSRYVEDGDYAIALRPPTLHQESVQPVRLSFWAKTCIGISPLLVGPFKGDYDGDEMHIYPVYSTEAVDECMRWANTPHRKLNTAALKYKLSKLFDGDESLMGFMKHTTVSFKQIRDGIDPPFMAEESRTRMEHIAGLRKRFDTSWCDENFIEDSIRGMADTNKQQLSQPIVGDMSRVARITASCVIQDIDGNFQVIAEDGAHTMVKAELDENAGNTAMRAISTVCAASQQSALDSHRANDDNLPSHDLVSDLMVGSSNTLVIINGARDIQRLKRILRPQLIDRVGDNIHCLCVPRSAARIIESDIIGTYNPMVLKHVAESRRMEVCKTAITEVVKYHSLAISDSEITAMAALYSFRPHASAKPVTTREGISARSFHWLDVTMANHYAGLIDKMKSGDIDIAPVCTASSALVAGNFRNLN